MTRFRDVTLHAVILLAAAFVMALAFPRTDWSFTPWLALAPLLAIASIRTPRTAFLWGWASGTLFFLVGGRDDSRLWLTDGTIRGTRPADDSRLPPLRWAQMYTLSGRLFLTVGYQLWTTDGTADGTALLVDFGDQQPSSFDELKPRAEASHRDLRSFADALDDSIRRLAGPATAGCGRA